MFRILCKCMSYNSKLGKNLAKYHDIKTKILQDYNNIRTNAVKYFLGENNLLII